MANLFSGLDTPKYLGPEERSLAAARGAGDVGNLFLRARAMRDANNDPMLELKKSAVQTQMSEAASRIADSELSRRMKQSQIDGEAADKLAFTNILTTSMGDDNSILKALSQTVWQSPMGVDNATQVRLAITARRSNELSSIDRADFVRRLSGLTAGDRSAIRTMSPDKDGDIGADQWKALGLAEERIRVTAENERKRAEIEALQSGAQVTTTIDEKGVTKKFEPPTPDKVGMEPKTMTLPDGTTLAWMPGGTGIHIVRGDKEQTFTPNQLMALSKQKRDNDDIEGADKIDAFLSSKAEAQMNKPTGSPTSGLPTATNPATGEKLILKDGKWQPLK